MLKFKTHLLYEQDCKQTEILPNGNGILSIRYSESTNKNSFLIVEYHIILKKN